MRRFLHIIALTLTVSLSFPFASLHAATPNGDMEIYDPLEGVNRKIHKFNEVFDNAIAKPVVKAYRKVVPASGRKGIRNMLRNLSEPVTVVNATLQGDVVHALGSIWRFGINSSIGLAGYFDVAGKYTPFKYRKEDFGQTLGFLGVKPGFYIVLPFLGPSSGRDVVGRVADVFTDPYNYHVDEYGIAAKNLVWAIDAREDIMEITDEIERTSLDPYASIRSLHFQARAKQVSDTNSIYNGN